MVQRLNATEIIADAEKRTGLSDWGGDEFREPFEILVNAINEQADLHELGVIRARQWLEQRLCQRLKLFETRKRRPEICEQNIERPIMVVGLPRAGTTYTHALLGADPANIAPLGWQMLVPSPPPNDPSIDHSEAIAEAQAMVNLQDWSNPTILPMHDYGAIMHPEECYRAFELAFLTISFPGFWNIPAYIPILDKNFSDAYRIHKKILQALQTGVEGRRWILKAPEHTLHFESMIETYPDAVVVQNHRDPSRVMASLMNLIRNLQGMNTRKPIEVTRDYALAFMQSFAQGQERLIELRKDRNFNAHFIDLHYLDLERDPFAAMRRIYEQAHLEFSQTAINAISHWIETNRKGKHGKHRYSLASIGVTQEEVHTIFDNYLGHFDIELETVDEQV